MKKDTKFKITCCIMIALSMITVLAPSVYEYAVRNRSNTTTELGAYKLETVYTEKIGGTVYTCFREVATDTMYLANGNDITVMYDPQTGNPLTYTQYLDAQPDITE